MKKPMHAVLFVLATTFALAGATLLGCPKPATGPADAEAGSQVAPIYDYGDASPECVAACAALDKIPQCRAEAHPKGGPGCAPVLCATKNLFHVDPDCMADAGDLAAMRRCGARCN